MSLFGALTNEMDDDMFFGAHLRHMRQMNNMMSSMFQDPFGMLGGMGGMGGMGAMGGGGHLPIAGLSMGGGMMPFMPQMPQMNMDMNRLMSVPGGYDHHHHGGPGMLGSYSSSTVVMSSGPNGRPQVYSATSSTKVGPNGVKETRKTVEDSMSGVKKMAIGHHIGERAHVVEREQNYISGDAEERQEFINIEEEEVEDFDREFQHSFNPRSSRAAVTGGGGRGGQSRAPQLAIAPPPAHAPQHAPPRAPHHAPTSPARKWNRPSGRRPLRTTPHTATSSHTPHTHVASSARETYGSAQPQRPKHNKHHKQHKQEQ